MMTNTMMTDTATARIVRYDNQNVLDVPNRRRAGSRRPGAFFYRLGHEGDGPDGLHSWPGRSRRVYLAPETVVEEVQSFSRFEFEPAPRQDVEEVFIRARDIRHLVEVFGPEYEYDAEDGGGSA